MRANDVQQILLRARQQNTDLAIVLSELLVAFFRERSQPLDPDFVSKDACRKMLQDHDTIKQLLLTAIQTLDDGSLWANEFLKFDGVLLRSRKPQTQYDVDLENRINEFMHTDGPRIIDYAKGTAELSCWRPIDEELIVNVPDSYKEFIASLRIPAYGRSTPSISLHKLGCAESAALSQRLSNVFGRRMHTIFVNAFGTGKTRLMYEGLARHWGIYMSYDFQFPELGASDMHRILLRTAREGPLPADPAFARLHPQVRYARELAQRVLLGRALLFRLYLESLPDVHDARARKRWLLLQLSPHCLVRCDIFFDLASYLLGHNASPDFVQGIIEDTFLRIRSLIGPDEPFFCVLDEAQRASRLFADLLGPTTALREIARCWEGINGLTVILAGQPFALAPFQSSLRSTYRLYTDAGVFHSAEEQANFVRQYLPPEVATSDSGEKLIARVCLWLKGRYLPTAIFIESLVGAQYMHPHSLLCAYVLTRTNIEPFEGPLEADADARAYFDFTMYPWYIAQWAILRMLTLGDVAVKVTSGKNDLLVSYDFATFSDTDGREAMIHEPLFVYPVAEQLFSERGPTYGFLCSEIARPLCEEPRHPPFHLAVLTLLIIALKGTHKLCDLFEIAAPASAWAEQTCRLVRMVRQPDGQLVAEPFVSGFPADEVEEDWATESPGWLRQVENAPFCVASQFSHADLLCTIQLADGALLHVAISILFKNQHVATSVEEVSARLTRMAPERLFEKEKSKSGLEYRLATLPTSMRGAGDPPLLRAFATFPDETSVQSVQIDGLPCPVAALRLGVLQKISEGIEYNSIVYRIYTAFARRARDLVGGASLQLEVE
ncbi:hypothetical protein HDZ31DRAFT_42004 [Schizophyllum fasciatum]